MEQNDLIAIGQIVPAGKYKGKPLEVLLQDPEEQQYWLDHPSLGGKQRACVVQFITNFGEASPTPRHNRFQIEFLDEDLCRRAFSLYAQRRLLWEENGLPLDYGGSKLLILETVEVGRADFEGEKGFDAQFDGEFLLQFRSEVSAPGFTTTIPLGQADVSLQCFHHVKQFSFKGHLKLEMKPVIGDDFPAVLRKMRTKKANCLLYDQFDACITPEQLQAFFERAKIVVMNKAELDAVRLPSLRSRLGY